MAPIVIVILAIIIIPMIVGAVAKLLNSLNEANAVRNRPPAPGGGGVVRQSNSDMDRFLAEIDRLRKKSADSPSPPSNQAPVVPVVQPARRPDRPRPRVVATLAEPSRQDTGFAPTTPTATTGPKAGDLPIAPLVRPQIGTGAPAATRVTKFVARPRPIAKTPFAKSLTGLLAGGQGLAMAIVLQEILGPAKSRKRG